jgi:hypothetical protein
MNTINASLFASFTPAVFSNRAEVQGIDNLIQAIYSEWQKVSELAASAKKALFAVKSHLGTYEVALKQKENTRRRAIINKQQALCGNYQAVDYAFRFFGQRLVANTRTLAALIPELVKDSKFSAGDSSINDARRSNTVVCTRIISDMPDSLRTLAAQFAPEDVMQIVGGGDLLLDLSMSLFEHEKAERFAAPLNIPYQYGVTSAPDYVSLEEKLVKLAAIVERTEQVAQAFERARSLAGNQEQFKSRLANVNTPAEARQIVKEADAAMVDYRASAVALDQGVSAIYYANLACEQQLKAILPSHGDSASGLYNVLKTNRIAAKCMMENALARRSKMRGLLDSKHNHDLRMTSFTTLETAFEAIPASFQFPHLNFLHCH